MLDFGKSSPVDLNRVEQALRADVTHSIKAVLTTHVDTSSSIRTDIPALRAAIARAYPAGLASPDLADVISPRHAQRLSGLARANDTAARLGGDEFALVLNAVDSPDAAMEMAHKVLAALVAPIGLDNGQHVLIGASIGVALFQGPAVEALSALMDRADRALYASKRGGKGLATLADAPGGAAAQPG